MADIGSKIHKIRKSFKVLTSLIIQPTNLYLAKTIKLQRNAVRHSSAGFTIPELMISVGLGMIVLGCIVIFVRSMNRKVSESKVTTQLIQNKEKIYQAISEDLGKAIYFDGQSTQDAIVYGSTPGSQFHGARALSRWPDAPRATATENDDLIIIAEKFSGLSQPVSVSSGGIVFSSTAETTLNEFVDMSFTKADLFSLTRTNQRELVEKQTKISGTEISLKDFSQILGGSVGVIFNMTPVEIIRYRITPDNDLVREIYQNVDQLAHTPSRSRLIASHVSKLQVDYGFKERDQSFKQPSSRLSHPLDFQTGSPYCNQTGDCCDPLTESCPSFSDVFDVQVSMDLYADTNTTNDLPDTSSFRRDGNKIIYSVSRTLIPGQLGILTADTGLVGSSGCNVNDLYNRCRPECNDSFTSDERSSPRWRGYRSGSDYCACGTDNSGTFTPPEIRRIDFPTYADWDPSGPNARVNACLTAFNPCDDGNNGWLQAAHPGAYLACHCLQPRAQTVEKNGDGTYQLLFDQSNIYSGILDSLSTDPASENNMLCRDYTQCDANLRQYTGSIPNAATHPNPWKDRCGCLLYNIDENGDDRADQPVYAHRRNWGNICNLGFPYDSGSSLRCGNTLHQEASNYFLSLYDADSNPQGLTPNEALFCECLRDARMNNQNYQNFDFRTPNDSAGNTAITNSPERASKPTFGAINAQSISDFSALTPQDTNGDGNPDAFLPTNVPGGRCDANYCNNISPSSGGSLGCATSTHFNSLDKIAFIRSKLAAGFQDYANYCTDQCNSSVTVGTPPQNELRRVREIITGTAPGGTLPDWCRGPKSQGSSL